MKIKAKYVEPCSRHYLTTNKEYRVLRTIQQPEGWFIHYSIDDEG